jgi:hypothetical protein
MKLFALGVLATHLFWASFFAVWWYRMTRIQGESAWENLREDFQDVRDNIRRAIRAWQN